MRARPGYFCQLWYDMSDLIAPKQGEPMDRSSFAVVKVELEDACEFLQSFTQGRAGFTRQDGLAGIRRVKGQCDRLNQLFASGPDAEAAATVETLARASVAAAETRLVLLRKQDG